MPQKEPVSKKSTRRPPARSIELKVRIIEAAAVEFATRGFGGATTRDIAARCGIGHPLLLYHFASKDALWVAVVRHLSQKFAESFGRKLADVSQNDVVERTRTALTDLVTFNVLHPEYHRLMLWEGAVESAEMEALVRTHIAPLLGELARLIRQCQKLKRFAEGDPFDLIYMFIGAASSCYLLAVEYKLLTGTQPDHGKFMAKHIESCVNLFVRPAASGMRPKRK